MEPTLTLIAPQVIAWRHPRPVGAEGRCIGRTDLPVQDPRKLGINMATGAAIIRNTVLKHWLDTLGLSATLELGGLRSTEYLRSMETIQPVYADAEDRVAG